jgi:ATPase subunit of ABC transporter with duplicated ATPase domains
MSNPVIRGILREYGGAIISVSHDRRYIAEVCGTVYELTENGLKSTI